MSSPSADTATIVECLDAMARADGEDTHGPALLRLLERASEAHWIALAHKAEVATPDDAERRAIVEVYRERVGQRCPRNHRACYSASCGGSG